MPIIVWEFVLYISVSEDSPNFAQRRLFYLEKTTKVESSLITFYDFNQTWDSKSLIKHEKGYTQKTVQFRFFSIPARRYICIKGLRKALKL